jgi:aspartyl-tRNA(Asn)/glutamyl-tRNA(Gln) amidotransferase subunit B
VTTASRKIPRRSGFAAVRSGERRILAARINVSGLVQVMTETIAIAPEILAQYEPVIGLEVHAQLLTETKAFSSAATEFGPVPNTNTDPVVLGHPGTLPVVNYRMIEFSIRMGLATNCSIRRRNTFARKNYFYPDLPKGYQISQFDEPICHDGWLEIEKKSGQTKRIGITRIHMEEDTGKLIHDLDIESTLVDLNRAGTPLIEIVSEPDIRSAEEAYLYLMQIRSIVTYLGVCSGNMEEGALRCDANISVRKRGAERFGVKTEVKNMNSFRNVEKAIEYEIFRQISVLEAGGTIHQETRNWDAAGKVTRSMRSKEFAHDYRYFPEPDLVPVVVTDRMLDEVRASLPELAVDRKRRFVAQYELPSYDAAILTETRALGDYFEACVAALERKEPSRFKAVSNVVMTDVLRVLTEQRREIESFPIDPARIAELVELFASDTISSKNVKDIFAEMLTSSKTPKEISQEKGFVQISDSGFLEDAIAQVLTLNAHQVEAYRGGKVNLFGFFVGETMKITRGKANPKLVTEILKAKLDS